MNILKKTDFIILKEKLKKSVSENRYQHSLRTVTTINKLAFRFELNRTDAAIAGIWHDYAREWDENAILTIIEKSDHVKPADDELANPLLLHGAAAAVELNNLIPDLPHVVFSAIRWHTAGSIEMGQLGYALFVSDFIEEGRKHLRNDEKMSIEKENSLEKMVCKILAMNFSYLADQGRPILSSATQLKSYIDNLLLDTNG